MLRYLSVWAVLLVFTSSSLAEENTAVTFEEAVKDLGGAPRGTKLLHQFKFTNTQSQPVHIAGVRTSCNLCTKAWPLKEDIAPGETSYIAVQIDTMQYSGYREFSIYVTFDRPFFTESRLLLKTTSRDDISISPDALHFGIVRLGSAPTAEVILQHRGLSNWTITGVENDNAFLQPKFDRLPNNPNGYKLSVRLREDTPAGMWHASLGIVTNDPTTPRLRIPLSVEIQGLLAVTPQTLNLGRLNSDKVERRVVVRGAKPFRITGIEGADGVLAVEPPGDEAKLAHVLKITYSGRGDSGELLKKLRILTDLDKASIELPVQGQVAK
jgi:hypothetical protein